MVMLVNCIIFTSFCNITAALQKSLCVIWLFCGHRPSSVGNNETYQIMTKCREEMSRGKCNFLSVGQPRAL